MGKNIKGLIGLFAALFLVVHTDGAPKSHESHRDRIPHNGRPRTIYYWINANGNTTLFSFDEFCFVAGE